MGLGAEGIRSDVLQPSDQIGAFFDPLKFAQDQGLSPEILTTDLFRYRYTGQGEQYFTIGNLFELMHRAQNTLVNNLFQDAHGDRYTTPSGPMEYEGRMVRLYANHQWLWDLIWNAVHMPDLNQAVADIDKFLSAQRADGFCGHIRYDEESKEYFPPGRIYYTEDKKLPPQLISKITQPPNIAWGIWEVYQRLQAEQGSEAAAGFLEKNYEHALRYHTYIYGNMVTPEGWMVTFHPWANGDDDSIKWMHAYVHLWDDPAVGEMLSRWEEAARQRDTDTEVAKLTPYLGMDLTSEGRDAVINAIEGTKISVRQQYEQMSWEKKVKGMVTDWLAGQGIKYERIDKKYIHHTQRPVDEDYDKYLLLIMLYNRMQWNEADMMEHSPFRIADPMTNAILLKSNRALLAMAQELGRETDAKRIAEWIRVTEKGLDALWDGQADLYYARDLVSNLPIAETTVSSFVPLFYEHLDPLKAEILTRKLASLASNKFYMISSVFPGNLLFDELRYWSGPVWVIMNTVVVDGLMRYAAMSRDEIIQGLRDYGHTDPEEILGLLGTFGNRELAERIRNDSLELLYRTRNIQGGSFEYFNPFPEYIDESDAHGGLGSPGHTWSAIVAFWLGMMVLSEYGIPVELRDFTGKNGARKVSGR